MRFVHTSDWHLGRSFHGAGLLGAQARYLDHLVELVRAERVDAVLVAGDVYDRALPGPDTVALLDDALVRLQAAGVQVIVSSGNHDSATRLGFGARVMEPSGVHIRTTLASVGVPVTVGDTHVYPIPFLEPSLVAEELGCEETTHAAVLRRVMERIRIDAARRPGRSVAMAHAFVTGATTSDSERDISVGGMGAVPVEVFDGVDHVALGHLHGAQQPRDHVRYSGSPVAMSFSETTHVKGSWLVDLSGATASHEFVEAPVERPLRRLRGELDDLLSADVYRDAEDAWCQVTLTDAVRPRGAMDRVRSRFPHTLQLLFDSPGSGSDVRTYAERTRGRSDLDLCCDFLEHVREGVPATDHERDVVRDGLAAAGRARRRKDDEGHVADVGRGRSGAA
ncbi:exonuclease SbcCD subunit D [Luteipulveratus sp. YIM 133132]|uniref:exonuclease SbcCD subunit D n=1 Tax=Luteipulveratus flavus TaxID=3031728 RepID=UPI0023AFC212|nr:exonuclease SbcCD subunit D [Luteipulveratus sp. YIM 133132]MDE9367373.1 exonuclease SbcCD subunit D [Luteipulveratus sp. YIM 133132]